MAADAATAEQEYVVIASFESRHAAERMLASLGRAFRMKARTGDASAFVVSGNKDGSLEITQSRVVTGADFSAALIRFGAAVMMGFMGSLSALKGGKDAARAGRVQERHIGSDEQHAHEILAQAGPKAAIALIRCNDRETQQRVASTASKSAAGYYWDGTLKDFLSGLDPSSKHDWVRKALGQPTPEDR